MGCRNQTRPALFKAGNHAFDGDHRIIDQQAQRNDQSTQRNSLKSNAGHLHAKECQSKNERDGRGDNQPGPCPQGYKRNGQYDDDRLHQNFHKTVDGILDDRRLIRDLDHLDPVRKLGGKRMHAVFQCLTEGEEVSILCHRNGQTNDLLSVDAHRGGGRIGDRAGDRRDGVEPEISAAKL